MRVASRHPIAAATTGSLTRTVSFVTVRDDLALRRGILAVTVLHDLDCTPDHDGIRLTPAGLRLSWAELADALDGADPQSPLGHERLAWYCRARLRLSAGPAVLPRPFAVPVGHPQHPGATWVRYSVPGGVLDLGLGIAGLQPAHPERISPLPPGAARAHGLHAEPSYAPVLDYLEQMAELAVARFERRPGEPLRPMGECDVVTLLAARTFRSGLVAGDGAAYHGLRTAAVPMRDRGWLDLRRIDPEFVACAAAATDVHRRGFPRPLLLTADELVLSGTRSGYSPRSASPIRRPTGHDHHF
jgi:hypothetical protein